MGEESHEQLVEAVQKAPSAEWIAEFFDLLNDLLSSVELRDEDPRLVISIVRGDRIAVSMNIRYVLVAFFEEPRIGFIIREGGKHTDDLIDSADGYLKFNPLQGEHADETPHWVEFKDRPKNILNGPIQQHWMRASRIEMNRWSGSPHQRFHEPLAKRATVDKEYRDNVLREAFSSP